MTKEVDARKRLMDAATKLFVAEGYGSVSVRDITAQAGTTVNMVNYYFGSKRGLYDEIINTLSEEVFMGPLRILEARPTTKEALIHCIEQYVNATIDALIDQREPYILCQRERAKTDTMMLFQRGFVAFVDQAKKDRLVRQDVDAEMLSGFLIGRLASQVVDADWIKQVTGTNICDPTYRQRWVAANLDIFLYGLLD